MSRNVKGRLHLYVDTRDGLLCCWLAKFWHIIFGVDDGRLGGGSGGAGWVGIFVGEVEFEVLFGRAMGIVEVSLDILGILRLRVFRQRIMGFTETMHMNARLFPLWSPAG